MLRNKETNIFKQIRESFFSNYEIAHHHIILSSILIGLGSYTTTVKFLFKFLFPLKQSGSEEGIWLGDAYQFQQEFSLQIFHTIPEITHKLAALYQESCNNSQNL